MMTMEGAIFKLPSPLRILNPNKSLPSLRLRFRPISSSSSPPLVSAPGDPTVSSLGHATRPDFPILHQVLYYLLNLFNRIYLLISRARSYDEYILLIIAAS